MCFLLFLVFGFSNSWKLMRKILSKKIFCTFFYEIDCLNFKVWTKSCQKAPLREKGILQIYEKLCVCFWCYLGFIRRRKEKSWSENIFCMRYPTQWCQWSVFPPSVANIQLRYLVFKKSKKVPNWKKKITNNKNYMTWRVPGPFDNSLLVILYDQGFKSASCH